MQAEILEDILHLIVVCKIPVLGRAVMFHQMFPHSHANRSTMWNRDVSLCDAGVAQTQDDTIDEALVCHV